MTQIGGCALGSNKRPNYGLTCTDSALATAEDGLLDSAGGNPRGILDPYRCSIAVIVVLGNVLFAGCGCFHRTNASGRYEPLSHGGKNQPIIPAETLAAADWLKKKERQEKSFDHSAAAGTETNVATAIAAMIGLEEGRIGGVTHVLPPRIRIDEG